MSTTSLRRSWWLPWRRSHIFLSQLPEESSNSVWTFDIFILTVCGASNTSTCFVTVWLCLTSALAKRKKRKYLQLLFLFLLSFCMESVSFPTLWRTTRRWTMFFYKVDLKFKHFLLWQMINNLNAHTRRCRRCCRRTSQMTTIKAISAVNTLTVDCCYAISDS